MLRLEPDTLALVTPGELIHLIAAALLLHLALAMGAVRWNGRHLDGGVDDALHVAAVILTGGLVQFVLVLAGWPDVPRSIPLIATLVALPVAIGIRVLTRLARERRERRSRPTTVRALVLGAGRRGEHLVRTMLADPASGYLPVGVIDDAPAARGRRIHGIPVRGTHQELAAVAGATGADVLVVAVGEIGPGPLRTVSRDAVEAGLRVMTVPSLSTMFRSASPLAELAEIDIADLIGREPVDVDVTAIAGYLRGRTVLVTGAGGSIGSELCRQVARYAPSTLLMLDRDESALHALQLSLHGQALLDAPDTILADIRDAATLQRIFREHRPHVVFHAAALKHLPMLERHPHEAWMSNVVGTVNVIEASAAAGVDRFVNISTDKAANPTSVLGRSKRIGERLVADAGRRFPVGTFVSVRFGNVLGSRGSVLTTFAEQIGADRPVTVTHPEVTRFFMTIPEAARLVVQAGAIGRTGEALVLDMGTPVRIAELARQLGVLAGRPVTFRFTGLRDGEKLHEELFGEGETDTRPSHPAVSHVSVPPIPLDAVDPAIEPELAAEAMTLLATGAPGTWPCPVRHPEVAAQRTTGSGSLVAADSGGTT